MPEEDKRFDVVLPFEAYEIVDGERKLCARLTLEFPDQSYEGLVIAERPVRTLINEFFDLGEGRLEAMQSGKKK